MYPRQVCLLVLLFALFAAFPALALKNVCHLCNTVADNDDLVCKKCQTPINKCLDCGLVNPVKNDVCASCSANLDEMRSLGEIDPEIRNELRLGQTDRSQLERAIGRLDNLMKKHPEQLETLMFRKGEVYFQLKNWGRAVSTWQEYLTKFPKSPRLTLVRSSLSEALCKIGWSRFSDHATEEALERFLAATEANPLNDNAWRLAAQMYRALGQQDKAAAAYMKALEANPGHKETIGFLRQFKMKIPPELLKPRPRPVAVATPAVALPETAAALPVASPTAGAPAPVPPAASATSAGGEVVVMPNVTDTASIPAPAVVQTPAQPPVPATVPEPVSTPDPASVSVPAAIPVQTPVPVPAAPATPTAPVASEAAKSAATVTTMPPVPPSDLASIPAPVGNP